MRGKLGWMALVGTLLTGFSASASAHERGHNLVRNGGYSRYEEHQRIERREQDRRVELERLREERARCGGW